MQTSENIHPEKQGVQEVLVTRWIGPVEDVQIEEGIVTVRSEDVRIQLLFVEEDVIRFRVHRRSFVTLSSTKAVVRDASKGIPVEYHEDMHEVRLTSTHLVVRIAKNRFTLDVRNIDGESVFHMRGIECLSNGETVCHVRSNPADHFYGLGEKTGFLDKRGEDYRMWNSDVYAPHNPETKALYMSVPFLIRKTACGAHGVFLDNPGETTFDMRTRRDRYSVSAQTGDLDCYFFRGPTLKAVISQYTALTGRLEMPPAWALGYHQSRYSYMDETEVRAMAKEFQMRNIPCDAIHLDIHYMDGYRVFTFDEGRFPGAERLVHDLLADGIHIVPIVDPGVKRDAKYAPYLEGVREDMFCKYAEGEIFKGDVWPGESVFPDFTERRVREWWGKLHRFYTELGIRGIWNDMNEPAVFNETKTMDVSVIHGNDGDSKTHGELHNLYGMLMSDATVNGLKSLLDNERPFLLTRAGYAGIGRFAAVWTGDNRSFWEHLSMAIPMMLNLGMSGIPFSGPDVGGFAHDTTGELLARWTQMGAFFPFFRNHSALGSVRQEPWAFTPEVEEICRFYIHLRYAYLPHLYTLFHEASRTGLPPVRPLVLEYDDDETVENLSDEFLVGTNLLVAPVTQPDMRKRLVYLPRGTWRDYHTNERLIGGSHIIADAPLARMPMYVAEGTILVRHDVGTHVDFNRVKTVTFELFGMPVTQTKYRLYEDDGLSYDYQDGQYNQYEFRVDALANQMVISGSYQVKGYTTRHEYREIHLKGLDRPVAEIDTINYVLPETFAACDRGWTVTEVGDVIVRLPASEDKFTLGVRLAQ